MNYIKQINAFYDRLETNSLSTSAIALWHALMHINNKAGWQREFSVAVSVLCVKTGLSERTISNARNELKQKKFIDFKSRKGNKSAVYILEDLSETIARNLSYKSTDKENLQEINADNSSDKNSVSAINADSVSGNLSYNVSDSVSDNLSALNKLNETKQNETNIAAANRQANNRQANFFNQYMLCFNGQPNPIQIEEINSFIDNDGLTEEVICLAFKKAAEAGAKYPYARAVLNSWAQKGIKTITDAQKEQEERLKKQTNNKKRVEPVPDWLNSMEQQSQEQKIDEKKKRELEERLKKYRKDA